jgi:hypothetical protein
MADEQLRDPNRRAFARTAIRQPATVIHGDTSLPVQTLDVGQGGHVLRGPAGRSARAPAAAVTFEVPLREGAVEVTAPLKVVYSSYVAAEQFKIGTSSPTSTTTSPLVLARFAGDQ